MPEAQATPSIFNRIYDAELLLHDGVAAVTPSAGGVAGVVGGGAGVVDLGAGQVDGLLVVDLQAIDTGTGDERYLIVLQGAADSAFTTSLRPLALIILGDSTLNFASADSGLGRYQVPFSNVAYRALQPSGPAVPSRFVRTLAVGVAGTIAASSFDYRAYLSIGNR